MFFERFRRAGRSLALVLIVGALPSGSASAVEADALQQLEKRLKRSCAGKALLRALDARPEGLQIELRLLTRELKRTVEERTGSLVSPLDPELLESAKVLKRLPRRYACNAEAALMVLIDEWTARATDTNTKRDRSERFAEKIRKARPLRDASEDAWLELRFPVLYREARRILAYLG